MLTEKRFTFKPFLYPEAFQFWLNAQQSHWLGTEVVLSRDLQDWKVNLTEAEKKVIGGILKSFTQAEVIVNDYWNKVAKWFPHPEISMAATTMASMETIHIHAYSLLDETLGFQDYKTYNSEPTVKAKFDNLLNTPGKTLEDKAKSLAVFSAFTEGVSLFSSFAVLLSFSRFNKLKGVGQIVSWSSRDESLHAEFGCYLFKKMIEENPKLWTDDFKKEIYQAARDIVQLEDDFIDQVFQDSEIEGLDKEDLKVFIRHRANNQLGKLGLKQNWKNIDKQALKRMEWFDAIAGGVVLGDFFDQKPTEYGKGVVDFDDMFDDEDNK